MGLMFIFPADESETERVTKKNESITLKTYGLPMVFWGYLLGILAVLIIMAVAIKDPLTKVLQSSDQVNVLLGWTVLLTMILIPLVLLAAYFYEKWITKHGDQLKITHRIFFLPVWTKTYQLKDPEAFDVHHFMDSPNVAKKNNDPNLRAFQNQGYFEMSFIDDKGDSHFLDRHARKADLKKMSELLKKF